MNQSQTNRIFENVHNVNKTEQSETITSGQSDISTRYSSRESTVQTNEKMDQENFYHWGATREIMEIIKRRNNSPETRRLVEQRNALSRPGTLDADTTIKARELFSRHPDRIKEAKTR